MNQALPPISVLGSQRSNVIMCAEEGEPGNEASSILLPHCSVANSDHHVDASVAVVDASEQEEGIADCGTVDVHGHHSVVPVV